MDMFKTRFMIRIISGLAFIFTISAVFGIYLLIESKNYIFYWSNSSYETEEIKESFPVGVNTTTRTIIENPTVNNFYTNILATAPNSKDNWWNKIAAVFSSHTWYQNLASPVSRIIVIWPGERKEEITKNIGDILGWNDEKRASFQQLINSIEPVIAEGKYFPGQYVTHRKATPEEIQQLINNEFQTGIIERYTSEVSTQVPLKDALIIASLLEREASDFNNMREVSGVIWNRLFIDMPLQLDATLQYVKGGNPKESRWWPTVHPSDKSLKSPYNTYQNQGLPPTPISNPSTEAVLAALNPVVTDCLYYFHTDNKEYICSPTYEEHVSKLRSIYSQGS